MAILAQDSCCSATLFFHPPTQTEVRLSVAPLPVVEKLGVVRAHLWHIDAIDATTDTSLSAVFDVARDVEPRAHQTTKTIAIHMHTHRIYVCCLVPLSSY